MTSEQERITELITEAISKFNQSEIYLLKNNLSERCICAKFMSYLEKVIKGSEFSEYEVDVEYNRGYDEDTHAPKILNGKKIVVDLIVHKRDLQPDGYFDNLICIEMKKQTNRKNLNADILRIQKMTCLSYGFNYQAGFILIIDKEILKIEQAFYLRENL